MSGSLTRTLDNTERCQAVEDPNPAAAGIWLQIGTDLAEQVRVTPVQAATLMTTLAGLLGYEVAQLAKCGLCVDGVPCPDHEPNDQQAVAR